MPNKIKRVEIDPVREKLVDVHGKLMGLLQRAPYIRCEDVHRQYAVNWLVNNGVTVQEWISVKERLPEVGENVLAYMQNSVVSRVFPAVYCKQRRKFMWWDNVLGVEVLSVTHWMPLPQPPKGE